MFDISVDIFYISIMSPDISVDMFYISVMSPDISVDVENIPFLYSKQILLVLKTSRQLCCPEYRSGQTILLVLKKTRIVWSPRSAYRQDRQACQQDRYSGQQSCVAGQQSCVSEQQSYQLVRISGVLYPYQLSFPECASVYPVGKRTSTKHCVVFSNGFGIFTFIRTRSSSFTPLFLRATPLQ